MAWAMGITWQWPFGLGANVLWLRNMGKGDVYNVLYTVPALASTVYRAQLLTNAGIFGILARVLWLGCRHPMGWQKAGIETTSKVIDWHWQA